MTPIIPIMTIVNLTPKIESSKEKSLEKRQEKQNQVKKQQASRKAEKRNEQRSPGLGSIKGEAQRKTHNNAQHKKSKRKHNRRKIKQRQQREPKEVNDTFKRGASDIASLISVFLTGRGNIYIVTMTYIN